MVYPSVFQPVPLNSKTLRFQVDFYHVAALNCRAGPPRHWFLRRVMETPGRKKGSFQLSFGLKMFEVQMRAHPLFREGLNLK